MSLNAFCNPKEQGLELYSTPEPMLGIRYTGGEQKSWYCSSTS